LEVDRGDAEVGVPELSLDDDERDAFVGHLDRVRVAQLVRCKPAPDTRPGGDAAELAAHRGGRRGAAVGAPVDDAEQWPDGQLGAGGEPGSQLFPALVVHPYLASASSLAAADQQRAAALVEVVLGGRERLLEAQPGAPQDDDHRSQAPAVAVVAGVAHDRHDLVDGWWVRRVAHALLPGGRPAW
jgi:hypothetical protein